MLLAIDSATAACSVALFDGERLIDERHEVVGRGHAERLIPMIDEMLAGKRPSSILVDCGPGSFTGTRVGLAAAHGLAIGWQVPLAGYSSMAAVAATAGEGVEVAVALIGGHGQLFVQSYGPHPIAPLDELQSLPPAEAAAAMKPSLVLGSGAETLVGTRGYGEARDVPPRASVAAQLPPALRSLPPVRYTAEGQTRSRCMPEGNPISVGPGDILDLDAIVRVMEDSFDPAYGEAWTAHQCAGLLPMPGVWLSVARDGDRIVGFALARMVVREAELLLLAVKRDGQRRGVGKLLLRDFIDLATKRGAERLYLEVRDGNPAVNLYYSFSFAEIGRRPKYYTGKDGQVYDAITLARDCRI